VCEVCMDDLIRRRLAVAVVVVGDGYFEVESPRAGLYSPGFKVIVGDQGQLLDEAVVKAVEIFQECFGFFGCCHDMARAHPK
jgi:hypothetical protein